jgi:hypothetical protein
MRQGRTQSIRRVALSCAVMGVLFGAPASGIAVAAPRVANAAHDAKPGDDGTPAKRSAATLRQFTGTVSAIDKTSITVEKHGRNPETRVFTKVDDMRTTGDVGKDARVTVYYRDEGGKAMAHRVVVKPARTSAKKG